jgi:diguanylate cyclase (GGDEF)-like protein/PAS domain S-box-containing protein
VFKGKHIDGQKLISELESILNEIHRHSELINQYVIISSMDLKGNITSVSQAFCDISGYKEEELIGKKHLILCHPDMPKDLYKELWQTIQSGKTWRGEIKNRKKNGDAFWTDVHIDHIKDNSGAIIGYTAVSQDITDHKYIEKLSITDELTGAYNRRYYNHILQSEIDRAKRDNQYLCFLMIDADNFKKYNDTYGHQAGDNVLKTIVTSTQSVFKRAGDFVFRLGGEEFAVLFRAETPEKAFQVSEKSRQTIYEYNIDHSGNQPFHRVTVSSGLMILEPTETCIVEEIYKYADQALYRAKQNGRNRIEIHQANNFEIFVDMQQKINIEKPTTNN